jgi:REP element-mobilizing transposase RayT
MIHETDGIFFITITCYSWSSLLQITNTYDAVYKWFDWLKKEGHYVAGYVVMPNHIHALIAFSKTKKNTNINKIIGNGKRFLAYEIIDRLKKAANVSILKKLSGAVEITDRKRGKLHEVYEDSFDIK